MYQTLCRKILEACYSIKVFVDDDLVSEGTAFAYTPSGELLTAAHVITGRFPIRKKDVEEQGVRIVGQAHDGQVIEYRSPLCGVSIECPGFSEPLQIDIGVLLPKMPIVRDAQFLPTNAIRMPALGEEVLIAGFSEEIELPFQIDRKLERTASGANEFLAAMRHGYEAPMGNLMIKRGIIGNLRMFEASSSETGSFVQGDVFYIDNVLHNGGSGGPVVNSAGEVVGIVSTRAVTSTRTTDEKVIVPSGSAMALSTRVLGSLKVSRVD